MNKFFVVFALFVGCCLAREIPKAVQRICSVTGTGTATVSSIPGTHNVRMVRVRDNARYDIFDASNGEVVVTVLSRDSKSYFYVKENNTCKKAISFLSLDRYNSMGIDKEGLDVYAAALLGPQGKSYLAAMYFDGNNLVKEYFNALSSFDLKITINYDNIDYSYTREESDNVFNMDESQCYSVSTNVTAKTSSLCGFVSIPDNICSFKAEGTATVGSTKVNVTMVRVGVYSRYDFYFENKTYYASIVTRPDEDYTYYYKPKQDNPVCASYDTINYKMFEYEKTEDGYDIFSSSLFYNELHFDHESHELVVEKLAFPHGSSYLFLDAFYSSWDHSYVHEDDDYLFSFEECNNNAKKKALYAQTSIMCSGKQVLKPEFPGCAFEYEMDYSSGVTYNYKELIKDDVVYFVKISYGSYHSLLRCDIKDSNGKCLHILKQTTGCEEEFSKVDDDLTGFEYLGVPIDVDCPDNTTGCKKYCDYDFYYNLCYIVDKRGYIININGKTLTYTGKSPSIHDFEDTFCNGTSLPAPPSPCSLPTSSTTSSTITSSTTSSTITSSAPLSSSSFIIPSTILVIIAILFVLF